MNNRGITLIELITVCVIVGILAAIAVPLYTGYMQRARRTDAKTALEQLRASQEMCRAERGAYAATLAILQTTWGGTPTQVGDYQISMPAPVGNTYIGTATPTTARQASDGSLTINQDGTKLPAAKWVQ